MPRIAGPWGALVLAAMLALTGAVASAQSQDPQSMTAQRSWAIQDQLRRIDADREAFVNEFLSQWQTYLDPLTYDVWTEVKPLAMKAPAWQLYGASLVGDFKTMVQVLTGMRGAGQYINSLSAPQQKVFTSPIVPRFEVAAAGDAAPAAIGDFNNQLVFTPIAPCRMVDTRESGARTGFMPANTSRAFDLTTTGYAKGQGGATSGCTGLPSFSYLGWALNITVTGYSGYGWLTAWGYTGTEPTASVINYSPTEWALANGVTLIGCDGCTDDIVVKAWYAGTHVIIDVVGYYQNATSGAASTVTRVAGTPVTIGNGARDFVYGGDCPAGTRMIGGEVDHGAGDLAVGAFHQDTATRWAFWMINNSGVSAGVTAYSKCMDTPVKVF